jgi:ATP-dependent DNA helicase RecQ
MLSAAKNLLKQYFGYTSFRKGQNEIITNLLDGKDTLGIMPTGGGKSICYQVPAMLFDGITIVVSPLISLMKDQVDALTNVGIPSTFINSSLSQQEVGERIRKTQSGDYKLLYIAPERLDSPTFQSLLSQLEVSLIAIDEAHCISQWGHDFRPSYMAIKPMIERLPVKPIIVALTATATPEVVKDISGLLHIGEENTFISGFARDNLTFSVLKGYNKRDFTLKFMEKNQQSGIIYAGTRKEVDQIHTWLNQKGYDVGKYHAGLSEDERKISQEKFLYDDYTIMVATNAFGMGINKSNVRFVLHYNLPKNMEAYYQEAGRAGRDGEESECLLLFNPQDVQLQKFLIEQTGSDDKRKSNEYKKLQQMIDYCNTERCLQSYILEYFGDHDIEQACRHCSNCTDNREKVEITKEAQMILSCVKRMDERFGKTLVAQVLKGSQNKRIKELGFAKLSTYGLLKGETEKDITSKIDFLIAEGYLSLTEGQYPVVILQEKSFSVLTGKEKVFRREELKITNERPANNELFDHLRMLRKEISTEEKVPPYIIFSDKTLREMSVTYPVDEASMLKISGVGQAKLEKYGEQFVEFIKEYIKENDIEPYRSGNFSGVEEPLSTADQKNNSRNPRKINDTNKTPSFMETYSLLTEGQSLEEISRVRDLSPRTVEGHIIQAATEGLSVVWSRFFTPDEETLILEKVSEIGAEKLTPLKEALPDEISYFAIKAVLCKRMVHAETVEQA